MFDRLSTRNVKISLSRVLLSILSHNYQPPALFPPWSFPITGNVGEKDRSPFCVRIFQSFKNLTVPKSHNQDVIYGVYNRMTWNIRAQQGPTLFEQVCQLARSNGICLFVKSAAALLFYIILSQITEAGQPMARGRHLV